MKEKEKRVAEVRLLNGITDSMDMNLGKLQEMVRDKEVWPSVVLGITKSDNYQGGSATPPISR